jgi:outer membrane immunogenic protein
MGDVVMKKLLGRSVALIVLLASPAMAADLAVKAPAPVPVAPVNDWSGFYLGAYAGYGWGHDPFQETLVDQPAVGICPNFCVPLPGPTIAGVNSRGWLAGGYAGYNWQYRQWVGGLEIDLSGTGIKGSSTSTVSASIFVPGVGTFGGTNTATVSDKFDLLGSARARLGFLAWPNLLLYGTGGLGWTRFVQTFSDTVTTTMILNLPSF